MWEWHGPGAGGNWSAAANWLLNSAAVPAAPAQQYPGQAGFTDKDNVYFDNGDYGKATLDVAINPINVLSIRPQGINTSWNDTLTLNQSLTVTGDLFELTDTSTINIAAGVSFTLKSVNPGSGSDNDWNDGTITGAGLFVIQDTTLRIVDSPLGLGCSMQIQSGGEVTLVDMATNLRLIGTNNSIAVQPLGVLNLSQQITTAGDEDKFGGISLAPAHTGSVAVSVYGGVDAMNNPLTGGSLVTRFDEPGRHQQRGAHPGAVYNYAGQVRVGSPLKITGVDGNNDSYYQDSLFAATNGTGLLEVDSGGNVNAVGDFDIKAGTVQLTAGADPTDQLDGNNLIFRGSIATTLNIMDATAGTPGTVTVQGEVTLGGNTTTNMNFTGGEVAPLTNSTSATGRWTSTASWC